MAETAAQIVDRASTTSLLATRLRDTAERLAIPRSSLILLLDTMQGMGCLRLEPETEPSPVEIVNALRANGLQVVRL